MTKFLKFLENLVMISIKEQRLEGRKDENWEVTFLNGRCKFRVSQSHLQSQACCAREFGGSSKQTNEIYEHTDPNPQFVIHPQLLALVLSGRIERNSSGEWNQMESLQNKSFRIAQRIEIVTFTSFWIREHRMKLRLIRANSTTETSQCKAAEI